MNSSYESTLTFVDKTNEGNRTTLHFTDPKRDEDHYFNITEENGDIEVTYDSKATDINRYWISFDANPSEHIYGCGETYSKFDLKGENVRIWVAEHQNTNRIGKKLIRETFFGKKPKKVLPFKKFESYYAQPTYVSSDKYFVHVFIDNYAEFNFQIPNQTTLYLQDKPHFVVKKADSFTELSSKVSDLLGHQRQLPDWTYDGAILAVQEGCDVIDSKIAEAESKGIRIAGIWSQDWCGCRRTKFGYQVMWNWEQDRELYPELEAHIKAWKEQGEDVPFDRMTEMAARAKPIVSFIDPDAPDFQRAGHMDEKIAAWCKRTGQPVPETKGAFARCALESMVLRYKELWGQLERITGVKRDGLNMIGGATRNALHCRMTADALGIPVLCGPTEGACAGNVLVQMIAMGDLKNHAEARELMGVSDPPIVYEPNRSVAEAWAAAAEQFGRLRNTP